MNRAFKFRIYPNTVQRELFEKTFGCVRFIYNKMLSDRIDYYELTGKTLKNTPAMYKGEYEWLKEVDSLALANAQLNLNKAYKNFFRTPSVGFPKFKSKRNHAKSYTTNYVNNNIRIEDKKLILPKLKSIKIKQHRVIPSHYTLKSVTISKTPTHKYYVSMLFEYEEEIDLAVIDKVMGLDFSMKELYVGSDGKSADYPNYYRKSLTQLRQMSRRLSNCKRGSKNRAKLRLKIARLHEKVANQRKDFLHKKSRQIANVYDVVCVEDLNMKAMSRCLNFGKSVMDTSYGYFLTLLEYKLLEQGKQLLTIDKWYPSSKRCSHCGHVKEKLLLSERIYNCEVCGVSIDRDYNASINIKEEGLRQLLA
ncbi:MAG: IS200/IS605 family element transposase accessory protein TnpB [Proteobacteria bacterium]|nr:IS200/IS605 family element transposase accessory protein TnpB [Pseudomonadota bacterium]